MQPPSLPFSAFLAAILVIIPLPWHWRARNVGTLAIMIWLFVMNIIYGVNIIVWTGNVDNPAPVWCDISTKLIVGANVALPIATMCICKHLELVSSNRHVRMDNKDRQRRIIFDSIMCFCLPLVFMALHYVVQGHRYDIIEDFGCQPAIYVSIAALFLVYMPPLVFSLATLVYAALALHHFMRRRLSFVMHLQNSNSALTTHRYLRLMAMAVTEMFWGTALTAFNIYSNFSYGLRPWISWQNVHSNFSRVDLYPTLYLSPSFLRSLYLFWWAMPASAFIFFLFFGFGEEARKEYWKVFILFRVYVLRLPVQSASRCSASIPNTRVVRPLKITSLRSSRSSDEKTISVSPSTTSLSKVMEKIGTQALTPQSTRMPPPVYSADVEAGHRRISHAGSSEGYEDFLEMGEVGRAYTCSIVVNADSATIPSDRRPFTSPSIYPVETMVHVQDHDCDGVRVTINTVRSADELV